MNIFDFTTDKDSDKEYPYKILVYPNITFKKDLEKDSYVVVLGNIIRELNKIRDDLFFTIISPSYINSLQFDNTVLVVIVPATKNYDKALQESIVVLDDRIWVYELSLGLMANLRTKAEV